MRTFEAREECERLIERLVWDSVSSSFGDFNGVKELSRQELHAMRGAIDDALERE